MEQEPKIARSSILRVVEACLGLGARRATFYQHPRQIVRATRRWKPRKGERTVELLMTFGKPNYRERRFISACQKAGEPFPVRKLQLEWFKSKTRRPR